MRIKQLKIEGFRSLKNVTWEPGDLNILIGPNGTGKSNLLRFLELMTVAAKGGLGKYIQSLGGVDAIRWDGQAPEISFNLRCVGKNLIPDSYELKLRLSSVAYWIANESLISKQRNEIFIERDGRKAQLREDITETL